MIMSGCISQYGVLPVLFVLVITALLPGLAYTSNYDGTVSGFASKGISYSTLRPASGAISRESIYGKEVICGGECKNGGIMSEDGMYCECKHTQYKGKCCEDKIKIFGYECMWTKYEWDWDPLPVFEDAVLKALKVPSYMYVVVKRNDVKNPILHQIYDSNLYNLRRRFSKDRVDHFENLLSSARMAPDRFSTKADEEMPIVKHRRDWWYGGYGSEYEGCLKASNVQLDEGWRSIDKQGRIENECSSCQPQLRYGWNYGIEANGIEEVIKAEENDDYDFEILISYGMFFGGSAGHAALILKNPDSGKPMAYSGNFYSDSETNIWGRRYQDPENFYDGENMVDITTKEMYLYKTSSNHGKGASFGIEYGAIYRRHLYGLRFHQPNRTEEWNDKLLNVQKFLGWMNEDFWNRDKVGYKKKTGLSFKYYSIEELNCASVLGAALEYAFDTHFDLLTTVMTGRREGGVFDTDTPLTLTNALMRYFSSQGVGVTGVLYKRLPGNAYVHRMQDEFTPTFKMQNRFPSGANWDYMRPKDRYIGPHDLYMASLFRRIMVRKVFFDEPSKAVDINCFDSSLTAAEKQDCAQDYAPTVITEVDRTQNVYYGTLFSEERNEIFKDAENWCCQKSIQACCSAESFSECESSICFLQYTNEKLYEMARSLSKKETGGYLQTFGDYFTFFHNVLAGTIGDTSHPLLSELVAD